MSMVCVDPSVAVSCASRSNRRTTSFRTRWLEPKMSLRINFSAAGRARRRCLARHTRDAAARCTRGVDGIRVLAVGSTSAGSTGWAVPATMAIARRKHDATASVSGVRRQRCSGAGSYRVPHRTSPHPIVCGNAHGVHRCAVAVRTSRPSASVIGCSSARSFVTREHVRVAPPLTVHDGATRHTPYERIQPGQRIVMRAVALPAVFTSIGVLVGAAAAAQAPPAETRQAIVEQTQADKVPTLQPYVPTTTERMITRVEDILTYRTVTWHPWFQSAAQGGGLPIGAGYVVHVSPYSFIDFRGSYTVN